MAKHDTIRLQVALVAKMGWRMYHFNVKSTFLNGLLERTSMLNNLKALLFLAAETNLQTSKIPLWIEARSKGLVWQN